MVHTEVCCSQQISQLPTQRVCFVKDLFDEPQMLFRPLPFGRLPLAFSRTAACRNV